MAFIIFPLQLFDVYNLSCIKLQLASKVWVLSGLICLENWGIVQLNPRLVRLDTSRLPIRKANISKIARREEKKLCLAGWARCESLPSTGHSTGEEHDASPRDAPRAARAGSAPGREGKASIPGAGYAPAEDAKPAPHLFSYCKAPGNAGCGTRHERAL